MTTEIEPTSYWQGEDAEPTPYTRHLEAVKPDDTADWWICEAPGFVVGKAYYALEVSHGSDGEVDDVVTAPAEANARLWAAAPYLLAELEHYLRVLEPLENTGRLDGFGFATFNGARAAIAKARGAS